MATFRSSDSSLLMTCAIVVVLGVWVSSVVAATTPSSEQCYAILQGGAGPFGCKVARDGGGTTDRDQDVCFLACALCLSVPLRFGVSSSFGQQHCTEGGGGGDNLQPLVLYTELTSAVLNVTAMHGQFFMDGPDEPEENSTASMTHLLTYMPRRDLLLLVKDTVSFAEFLFEHVRYALFTRAWSASLGVTLADFLNHVVPYSALDEKRDLQWRWRPRFFQLFWPVIQASKPQSMTDAMRALVTAIPTAQAQGVLAMASQGETVLVPGTPITWHSETSPGFLSPQQVAQHGGSCTGTAIVLVAAARSVGIPTRLAGCSESVIKGDDHHWAEFWDNSTAGPFGDNWHTKEGVSAGNAGGPWDSPSGPMLGCLAGVTPGSSLSTIWATSWDGVSHIPALWADSKWAQAWARVPGSNRCGAYCTAWGCGTNHTQHWSQTQCGPKIAQ